MLRESGRFFSSTFDQTFAWETNTWANSRLFKVQGFPFFFFIFTETQTNETRSTSVEKKKDFFIVDLKQGVKIESFVYEKIQFLDKEREFHAPISDVFSSRDFRSKKLIKNPFPVRCKDSAYPRGCLSSRRENCEHALQFPRRIRLRRRRTCNGVRNAPRLARNSFLFLKSIATRYFQVFFFEKKKTRKK